MPLVMRSMLVTGCILVLCCSRGPATEPKGQTSTASAPVQSAPPPPRFLSLVAGETHSCLLLREGRVLCWGNNEFGQLGDGPPSETPDDTSCHPVGSRKEPASPEALAAKAHYCFKYSAARSQPVSVLMDGFVSITAGARHTCGLRRDRTVWCWGDNLYGQCGVPDWANHIGTPMRVPLVADVAELVAGESHTCARTGPAAPWRCWGASIPKSDEPSPFKAKNIQRAAVLDRLGPADLRAQGNSFACVARGTRVRCIGDNRHGQLGGGYTPGVSPPGPVGPVEGITDAVQISVTDDEKFACAVLRSGRVRCWGDLDRVLPIEHVATVPLEISDLSDAEEVDTTARRICVRTRAKKVLCYSDPMYPNLDVHPPPQPLFAEDHAERIALVSPNNACWLRADGTVGCVGYEGHRTIKNAHALVTAGQRVCALQTGGEIWCFGPQIKDPGLPYGEWPWWNTARHIATFKGAVEIAMSEENICVRHESGSVMCPVMYRKQIRSAAAMTIARDAVTLGEGPCWVKKEGTVGCLAYSIEGRWLPQAIEGISDAIAVERSCALRRDGTVWCWGSIDLQGRGGVPNRSDEPVEVALPDGL